MEFKVDTPGLDFAFAGGFSSSRSEANGGQSFRSGLGALIQQHQQRAPPQDSSGTHSFAMDEAPSSLKDKAEERDEFDELLDNSLAPEAQKPNRLKEDQPGQVECKEESSPAATSSRTTPISTGVEPSVYRPVPDLAQSFSTPDGIPFSEVSRTRIQSRFEEEQKVQQVDMYRLGVAEVDSSARFEQDQNTYLHPPDEQHTSPSPSRKPQSPDELPFSKGFSSELLTNLNALYQAYAPKSGETAQAPGKP